MSDMLIIDSDYMRELSKTIQQRSDEARQVYKDLNRIRATFTDGSSFLSESHRIEINNLLLEILNLLLPEYEVLDIVKKLLDVSADRYDALSQNAADAISSATENMKPIIGHIVPGSSNTTINYIPDNENVSLAEISRARAADADDDYISQITARLAGFN